MAVTSASYTGNGSNRDFAIPFPYLEPTHVFASINSVLTTAWTFLNSTTVRFNTAPPNGANILIYRATPSDAPLATFQAGSAIRSGDLNKDITQTLYLCQETQNVATGGVGGGGGGGTDLGYVSSTSLLTSSSGTDVTLPLFTDLIPGFVPPSGGNTTKYLRGDGTWQDPPVSGSSFLPLAGGIMTGNITFNGAQTFPVAGIQSGTTSQVGVVQLNNATNSSSTTQAATANAVKTVNDSLTVATDRITVVENRGLARNMVSNSLFLVNQVNGTSAATPAGVSPLIADRWRLDNSAGGLITVQTFQEVIGPTTGITSYQRVTTSFRSILSTDFFSIAHAIEGHRTGRLLYGTVSARTSTVSFWIRCSVAATLVLSITNLSKSHTYLQTFAITAPNTWEQKTIQIPGTLLGTWNTGLDVGARIRICFASGSSRQGTSGSWSVGDLYGVAGQSNLMAGTFAFDITAVQWEEGTTASDIERLPISEIMNQCLRFYYSYKGPNTIAAHAAAGGQIFTYPLAYPNPMRIVPQLTRNGGTLTNCTVSLLAGSNTNTGIQMTSGASGAMSLALGSSEDITANAEFTA